MGSTSVLGFNFITQYIGIPPTTYFSPQSIIPHPFSPRIFYELGCNIGDPSFGSPELPSKEKIAKMSAPLNYHCLFLGILIT